MNGRERQFSVPRLPLGPRKSALVVFLVAAFLMFGIFAIAGETGPTAYLLVVWSGAFAVFVAYRLSYFAEVVPVVFPGTTLPRAERMRRTTGRPRLLPDADPRYISVQEANAGDNEVRPEDRVIGIEVNGHTIAYPLAAMSVREIAHEIMDGTHVFVTWWPVTYSARAFALQPNGDVDPALHPVRKTLLNSSIVGDQSGNEIVQFLGQAVKGPSAGSTLQQIPVISTNWRAWSGAFPHTDVMSLDGTPDIDIFERYYITDRAGLHQQSSRDRRWHDKDTVLGLEVNGESRSYPYPALIRRPLLNDELGREPILVANERVSATAVAFSRVVNGRTLTFSGDSRNPIRPQSVPGEGDISTRINYEPWYIVDSQTGSRWRVVSGECVSGELKGARLQMLPGQTGFWFAWSRFYPNADVLEQGRQNRDEQS
jgi:hypothetical protein